MRTSFEQGQTSAEVLHAEAVPDPYRWLEDRTCPETESWINEQEVLFNRYFEQTPRFDSLRNRIRELVDVEVIDQVGEVCGRRFYRKRYKGAEQPAIYWCSDLDKDDHLLVDPSAHGRYASVGIYRISPDGRTLAYELKIGGEHTKEVHIVDVDTGEHWPDYLPRGLARGFEFATDTQDYFYCHELIDSTDLNSPHYSVRFHSKGQTTEHDAVLFSVPRNPPGRLLLRGSGNTLLVMHCYENGRHSVVDVWTAHQGRRNDWVRVCHKVPAPFSPFVHRDRLFAFTTSQNANGGIVEFDPVTGRLYQTIVPAWRVRLLQIVVAGESLFVQYLDGDQTIIREWSLSGEYLREIPLAKNKAWTLLPTHSFEAVELILRSQSFAEAPSLYRYRIATGESVEWGATSDPVPRATVTSHRFTYSGRDGVPIGMTILGIGGRENLFNRPVIMTAYGASGLTLTPRFSVFVLVLLELGFLFAVPAIRGGGERGQEWYEAARKTRKQVAFDDFIAAAEWLCSEGITCVEHLAIFGGSFGGLLVGVVLCQRPDLVRAVVCIAPLLDMLRYHLFDGAATWSSEYGTADDPEEFDALHRYSPYHAVREDVNYPAVLFITGDKDTRCNPAHVRKMAARLQMRSAQTRPVIVDHSAERGHSPTLPLTIRVEAVARRIAFICAELNVPWESEEDQ
jgi:prolyl oligopeptidase